MTSVSRCNVLPLTTLLLTLPPVVGPVTAQPTPPIEVENLGGSFALLANGWLLYTVQETFAGKDLNGNGAIGGNENALHVRNLSSAATVNLGLSAWLSQIEIRNSRAGRPESWYLSGEWFTFPVSEHLQGEDLNGDGDRDDQVLHTHNPSTGETRNLRLARRVWGPPYSSGSYLAFPRQDDRVVHVHRLSTGETTSLGIRGEVLSFSGNRVVITVDESLEDRDLNADGDRGDSVFHVHDPASGNTNNLRLGGHTYAQSFAGGLVLVVDEGDQGEDLNGDGDTRDGVFHIHRSSTGETTNLRLAGICARTTEDWVVLLVRESNQGGAVFGQGVGQGEDLNGDGDLEDALFYLYDDSSGGTTNLGLSPAPELEFGIDGDHLIYLASEWQQQEDLNKDGDTEDRVHHVHNLATGETRNLGFAHWGFDTLFWWDFLTVFREWLVFDGVERLEGEDLNGDGDIEDKVAHLHNLSTGETRNLGLAGCFGSTLPFDSADWLVGLVSEGGEGADLSGDGDTDDLVLHVHNLSTAETTNLKLAVNTDPGWSVCYDHLSISGNWLVLSVDEDIQGEDLNSDGLIAYGVYLAHIGRPGEPRFPRGDCNDDGTVDISDAVFTLETQFLGQGEPTCDDACDSNDDGTLDISDPIVTLQVLFLGNGTIPPPGMTDCGVDPTDDELGCETAPASCQ